MTDPLIRLTTPRRVRRTDHVPPLGQILLQADLITSPILTQALTEQRRLQAPLGEILIAGGHIAPRDLYGALAEQHAADFVDLDPGPVDLDLARALPAPFCLAHKVVPFRWLGDTLLVATAHPDQFAQVTEAAAKLSVRILPVVALPTQINARINRLHGAFLAHKAMIRTPEHLSCRSWARRGPRRALTSCIALAPLALCLGFWPDLAVLALSGLSILLLLLTTVFKAAAFLAERAHAAPRAAAAALPMPDRLPRVSVMVPLYKETEIAEALVKRLKKLTYPKSLLDVILVLEARDRQTKHTLEHTDLPHWMRVVEVPESDTITTKPRALNYAFDFCDGDIIGVWDAEDAPATDQVEKVVAAFAAAPDDVVCLQGKLDYYNARANWMARCFAIEYATWWRMMLPGVEKLGLVLPLGGTTLFFRRDELAALGAWDAHNVTEDADLGVRLARQGYKTQLIDTVTYEEAACRPWAWVRQRSRWLKGFLVTYLVHMRAPRQFLRDLGLWRFCGVQMMFLISVTQFALAPITLSFWAMSLGAGHPLVAYLSSTLLWPVLAVVVSCEVIGLLMSYVAVSRPEHAHLKMWVITLPVYFLLGSLAAYKAIAELIITPFFWDKTQHGVSQ